MILTTNIVENVTWNIYCYESHSISNGTIMLMPHNTIKILLITPTIIWWVPTWHQMGQVSWSRGLFKNPPLGSRPNTKPRDFGTPNAHHRWIIPYYHMWGPACPVTYDFALHLRVWDHTKRIWRRLGEPLIGHFLLGSHNFMVTALWVVGEVAISYNEVNVEGVQYSEYQDPYLPTSRRILLGWFCSEGPSSAHWWWP